MVEINVRNKSRWKQDGYYVGRPTVLGNPFRITEDQTRDICIQRYANGLKKAIEHRNTELIYELQKMEAHLIEHNTLNLVCWCAPESCHADIIKQVLLNKFHTNYWLIHEVCPTCGGGQYKIGVHGL